MHVRRHVYFCGDYAARGNRVRRFPSENSARARAVSPAGENANKIDLHNSKDTGRYHAERRRRRCAFNARDRANPPRMRKQRCRDASGFSSAFLCFLLTSTRARQPRVHFGVPRRGRTERFSVSASLESLISAYQICKSSACRPGERVTL